jgi:hypothetical protein
MTEPMRRKKGLLLVMIDVEPEHEEDFNRWYREEHYPERMACPGILTGRRFIALEGEPKYLAIYDLESPEVLDGPDYQKIAAPSEWAQKLLPHFVKRVRNVYVEIDP